MIVMPNQSQLGSYTRNEHALLEYDTSTHVAFSLMCLILIHL